MTTDTKVNTAIVDATEASIENAIRRGRETSGAFPYADECIRSDEAAARLAGACVPLLFPRPERDASDGASDNYVPQRERLENREALDHAENRSRRRVIDNGVNNGGQL